MTDVSHSAVSGEASPWKPDLAFCASLASESGLLRPSSAPVDVAMRHVHAWRAETKARRRLLSEAGLAATTWMCASAPLWISTSVLVTAPPPHPIRDHRDQNQAVTDSRTESAAAAWVRLCGGSADSSVLLSPFCFLFQDRQEAVRPSGFSQ